MEKATSVLESQGLLKLLKRLAGGIVALVGPHCEVVMHDFGDPEHSAVVIAGDVTHRQQGAPVSDISFISGELDKDTPDQLNYQIRVNNHTLQSSTIWLRDLEGNLVGAACINLDYSGLQQARMLLEQLSLSIKNVSDFVVSNTFAKDLDNLIELSIRDFLHQKNLTNIGT